MGGAARGARRAAADPAVRVLVVMGPSSCAGADIADVVGGLLFSGELVDAPTILRAGLVDRLVDADDLAEGVAAFADRRPLRSPWRG